MGAIIMNKIFSFDNLIIEYKSKDIDTLTSDSLFNFKEQIIEAIKNRRYYTHIRKRIIEL
jgi:hypothetical protein